MGTSCTIDLEGKCMALWVLQGIETEEWNGDSCNCELIQGTYNCKLNQIEEDKKQVRSKDIQSAQEG